MFMPPTLKLSIRKEYLLLKKPIITYNNNNKSNINTKTSTSILIVSMYSKIGG